MTDHKFTDEEIIKALECCYKGNHCRSDCPYDGEDDSCVECTSMLAKDALDLINRQKAQIDDLKVELDAMRGAANSYKMHYENARAEAIKEFAERLKQKGMPVTGGKGFEGVNVFASNILIDTLVKEMTEDNNESQNT